MLLVIGLQVLLGVGKGGLLLLGVLVGQDGVGEHVLQLGLGHVPAIVCLDVGRLRAQPTLDAVQVEVVHVVLDGLLACLREGVAVGLGLLAQDGHLLQLVQGLLEEVIGIGDALLLVVHLLGGGQGSVIAHVHAELLILLGLGDVAVGHGVVVIGDLGDGILLVAHGGGDGPFIAEKERMPDQQRGHQHGDDDADGPVALGLLAHGLFLLLVHSGWFLLLVFSGKVFEHTL